VTYRYVSKRLKTLASGSAGAFRAKSVGMSALAPMVSEAEAKENFMTAVA